MKKLIIFLTMFLTLSNAAMADCTYNGKSYPEGTVIGPFVCSGGVWKDK